WKAPPRARPARPCARSIADVANRSPLATRGPPWPLGRQGGHLLRPGLRAPPSDCTRCAAQVARPGAQPGAGTRQESGLIVDAYPWHTACTRCVRRFWMPRIETVGWARLGKFLMAAALYGGCASPVVPQRTESAVQTTPPLTTACPDVVAMVESVLSDV